MNIKNTAWVIFLGAILALVLCCSEYEKNQCQDITFSINPSPSNSDHLVHKTCMHAQLWASTQLPHVTQDIKTSTPNLQSYPQLHLEIIKDRKTNYKLKNMVLRQEKAVPIYLLVCQLII